MRSRLAALMLPLLSLAACGGAGTNGVPTGFGAAPPAAAPTPPPTTAAPNQTNLFDVTAATSFDAVGSLQSLRANEVDGIVSTVYQGNASTVAAPSGTITYDPRDGIFNVVLTDAKAGVAKTINFQDPAHRANADGARSGSFQVPLLPGFNYLQALDGKAQFTFFYQRPGTTGSFVSLAGFERSELSEDGKVFTAEQGAFVFGTRTSNMQTPERGSGQYDGQFLASMVGNRGSGTASVLQWINGTSSVSVDFAARSVGLTLNGTVGPAYVNNMLVGNGNLAIGSGTSFTAAGSASWAQGNNAFAGRFSSAAFGSGSTATAVDFTSVSAGTGVAGASSIDGTFYGPNANNVGGNFRIVGGIPNQRVDILGAFVGAKK